MPSHPGLASVQLSSSGAGVLRISHDKSGFYWDIYQLAISSTPAGAMDLVTTYNDQPLMSPVTVLSGSAAHGHPSISLYDHDTMTITVANGVPLANVVLSYYYDELAQ